jgi:hypothetical protein
MIKFYRYFFSGLIIKALFLTTCFSLVTAPLTACSPITLPVISTPLGISIPSILSGFSKTTPNAASTSVTPGHIDALSWDREPMVPIILYHRFIPDSNKKSSRTKLRLGEFRQQLQSLYDAGYSLISLDQWLKGDLSTPVGRRPLILTLDDAFFADQIFLDPDGSPSPKSGIGVLWQFSQEHLDFGFSVALFSNMGDKLYANQDLGSHFINNANWKPALANVITWCIEHNVIPYNHLYHHPRLDLTSGEYITSELRRNDTALEQLLALSHHDDLEFRLDNIIAIPYSIWPSSAAEKKLITNYLNPRRQPALAVLEAGYYHDPHPIAYSPYSSQFERYHIPRITMNTKKAVAYLVDNRRFQ